MTEPALFLNDPYERDRRRALLNQPHMRKLKNFAARLRRDGYGDVPDFDPLDGGINARMLFLLEKPGKSAGRNQNAAQGSATSGFVSRDNASQSAKTLRRFMDEAGIDRRDTILWNVVPGWNGTAGIRKPELARGISAVKSLLKLLPQVEIIVCVGRQAQNVQGMLDDPQPVFFSSYHPSPNNFAAAYDHWRDIPNQWRKAQEHLERHGSQTLDRR